MAFGIIVFAFAFATFLSTLIGGYTAIRLKRAQPYLFAFASGALIAVAFLDLLPEGLNIAQTNAIPIRYVLIVVVLSYLFYNIIERFLLTHHFHNTGEQHGHLMGPVGASSLSIHSFLDGVAIGTAYIASPAIGIVVALAVIFHDFTDGINTVTVMLKSKQPARRTTLFLFLDAIAPVIGVFVTLAINIGEVPLAFLLAMFSGEFLYLGASHLLPETFKHSQTKMMLLVACGVFLIMILTSLISI